MQQLAEHHEALEAAACSDTDLESGLSHRAVALAFQQRDLLRFVREYDSRRLWEKDGCRNMGQWLAGHFGISVSAGSRWTHAAHALEHLPVISDAFARGAISLDKVLQLARFATAETERELLRYARRASLIALRRRADLANRPDAEDHNADHHARFLEWRRINDAGAIYLEALLPAAEGAIVTRALKLMADELPDMPPSLHQLEEVEVPDWFETETGSVPAETIEVRDGVAQKLADALVALASGAAAEGAGSQLATVVVSTSLSALQSEDIGCEIEGAGVVHPEIARRLACDCRLQWILRDDDEIARGIGIAARNVDAKLRRELMHRDTGCTFPGCGARHHLQAHHIWHWEHGGPTRLDNLTLVCHFHHRLVHEHGWLVELDERQRARWLRPNRTRYEPELQCAA